MTEIDMDLSGLESSGSLNLEDVGALGDLLESKGVKPDESASFKIEDNQDNKEDNNEPDNKGADITSIVNDNDDDGGAPSPENTNTSSTSDDESPWSMVANELKGSIFEEEDFEFEDFKFDGSKESLEKMIQMKTEKLAESFVDEVIESLPSNLKNPLKAFLEGAEPNKAMDLGKQLSFYQEINKDVLESNPDKAKEVLTDYYKQKGFPQAKIDKMISKSEELLELTDEALEAAEEMVPLISKKIEDAKLENITKAEANKQAAIDKVNKFKESLMSREVLFPGLPTTEALKKKIYENMVTPFSKDENGKPLNKIQTIAKENPTEFQTLLNYYVEMGLFNHDPKKGFVPDLKKITNYRESKKIETSTNTLKEKLSKWKGGAASNTSVINEADVQATIDTIKSVFGEKDQI